jgi:DNA-binding NarL/FixJ family response regulator
MKSISLALVDDEALIVALLSEFLGKQERIEILYTADSGEQFLETLAAADALPEVVVMDLKMKELSGTDVLAVLKTDYPSIQTIIMSSHYKPSFMGFMLKSGAAAFIPKGISPSGLLDIIIEVGDKGFFFLPEQMEALRGQVSSKAPKPVLEESNKLSERELEILRLICFQKTAKEIAEELFIAQRTVEGHKNTLFAKTGAKNVAGLVIYAIQNNLVDADDIPMIG